MHDLNGVSDEILVERAKANDQDAYTELYRRLLPLLNPTVGKILRMFPQEAEDCVAQVAAKIFVRIDSFEGTAKFKTWCTRIAINQALMRLRELNCLSRERLGTMVYIDHPIDKEGTYLEVADQDPSFVQIDQQSDLRKILRKLPAKARLILELHYLMGLQCDEIAEMQGISVGGCKSIVHRATRCARETVQKLEKQRNLRASQYVWNNCEHE